MTSTSSAQGAEGDSLVGVFAIDAGALEGVWRILSFLGLGVALIGIGRLYGPVLRAERPAG